MYDDLYPTAQMFWVSFSMFLKEVNTFILQGCFKLLKIYSKDI